MPIKTITPIALLFAAALAQAEPLYFYAQKDKIGVKTASGRIVIAPVKVMLPFAHYAEAKRPIREHTIEICFSEHFNENRDDAIAADAGDVFSRSGQYLYSPIVYDNDCDYWQEGMRRYVENGRVGFVRRDGSRATPAQWDFATPFEHGYATVYRGGWQKEWTDDEHWTLAPATPDAVSEVINQRSGSGRQPENSGRRRENRRQILSQPLCLHPRRAAHGGLFQPTARVAGIVPL